METLHILMLILLHQVVSHSCRGISDSPNPLGHHEPSDDDEPKFEDIRSVLRVVPYPELIRWKSNYSRLLPVIKKQNAAPIAIILAPSNIAAKFQHKQRIPGLDEDSKNFVGMYGDSITSTKETEHSVDKETIANTEAEEVNFKRTKNFGIKHKTNDENVKLPDVKSHEYTHFILDKKTFNNENDESIHKTLEDSQAVHNKIENSVEVEKELSDGDVDDNSRTNDNFSGERDEKKILEYQSTLESDNNKDTFNNINIRDTKLFHHSEVNDGELDLDSKSEVSVTDNSEDKLKRALKGQKKFERQYFHPGIECIQTHGRYGLRNGTYSVINLLFNFHR